MPEQLPEELSREKVPGALSKAPNINGSAPPRVRIKLGGAGDRFGGFLFAESDRKWTKSIYKHKIHQTYYQNFKA